MIPERTKLLWKLIDAHEKSMKVLKEIEATLGNSPAAEEARASLRAQADWHRRVVYVALYSEEPPVDLPNNWEEKK